MSEERFIHSAYAYLYIGSFERAQTAFKRAIELDPTNPELYFLASITAHRNRAYEEALALVRRAVELAPSEGRYTSHFNAVQASLLVEEGKSAYIHGDTEAAIQIYQKAIEADPLHDEAWSQLAKLSQLFPEYCSHLNEEVYHESDTRSDCGCGRDGAHGP